MKDKLNRSISLRYKACIQFSDGKIDGKRLHTFSQNYFLTKTENLIENKRYPVKATNPG